jgi:hypothetical protein
MKTPGGGGMAKKQTRSDLAKFLETPLGNIDRAFCDFQLASHWLLYAAGGGRKKNDLLHHLRSVASLPKEDLNK